MPMRSVASAGCQSRRNAFYSRDGLFKSFYVAFFQFAVWLRHVCFVRLLVEISDKIE
jgi:hypothetical protein